MVDNFLMPPTGFGPGSQATDDTIDYMPMPQEMRTYVPRLPETDSLPDDAMALMADVGRAATALAEQPGARSFDLSDLSPEGRALIAETMGEGEVSIKMRGVPAVAAQESVFAGVWLLKGAGVDRIEVARIPTLAVERAFHPVRAGAGKHAARVPGLASAPALIEELLDKSASFDGQGPPHVVNLTLLPHSEPDLVWLDTALGEGSVTLLSRGYGNCRIAATATPGVWRVQFFNSMDALILDTFEVTAMPEVAIAAQEDLADSGRRIASVLEAIQ
jgi:hydrogenase-1 operon protein HyaF